MSPEGNLSEQVLMALRQIMRAVDLHSRSLVSHHGVTGPQLIVLRELASRKEESVGVVAKNVSLSHATVTGILDRLERRGLVRRLRKYPDKRRVIVSLTEGGEKLLSAAPPLLQERFLNGFTGLPDWEKTLILSSLQRVASMMDADVLDVAPILVTGPAAAPQPVEGPVKRERPEPHARRSKETGRESQGPRSSAPRLSPPGGARTKKI